MSTRTALFIFLSALFALLAGARVAAAQDDINVEESKKHFDDGVELFKKEKFRDALDEFDKAYSLRPHWNILYNIGLCHLKLGENAKALMTLLKFMEKGGDKIQPKTVTLVESFIQDLMADVGIIRFEGNLANAEVVVDGEPCPDAALNMYIYVDPGKRYVRVSKLGTVVFEDRVTIAKGEEIKINIETSELVPEEPVTPDEPEVGTGPGEEVIGPGTGKQPVPVTAHPGEKKKPDALKAAGWTLAALSVGLLAGYAAAGSVVLAEKDKMRDVEKEWNSTGRTSCTSPSDCTDKQNEAKAAQDEHYDKAVKAKLAANVLFAVGLSAAATSIALFIVAAEKKKKEKKLHPTVAVSPTGASLELKF
jgi:tetratricopeptide (TPR) repeat protein